MLEPHELLRKRNSASNHKTLSEVHTAGKKSTSRANIFSQATCGGERLCQQCATPPPTSRPEAAYTGSEPILSHSGAQQDMRSKT